MLSYWGRQVITCLLIAVCCGGGVFTTNTALFAQQMTDTVVVRTITFDGLSGKGLTAEQVLQAQLKLQKMDDGSWAAPASPDDGQALMLAELSDGQDHVLQLSAVQQVVQAVAAEFNRQRIAAVRSLLTRSALNNLLAKDSDGTLTIKVVEGYVGSISAKTPEGEVADDAVFERVVRQSPVGEGDVIQLDAVDRYVAFLNRHPRRQVDAVVAPGPRPGELALDYQVQQDNPLLLYFQVSNTGTDNTGDWRERFGLSHFNLTGADDILSVDYITGNFDEVHYVNASYERPLPGLPRVKARVFGSYSEYTASDVGVSSTDFEGQSTTVGAELVWNFFQHRSLFLDLVGGFTYRDDSTYDSTTTTEGDTEFFVVQTGLRLDLQEDYYSVLGSLLVDTNIPGVADTDRTQIPGLGRTEGDTNFSILRYNLTKQFYLEPLFDSFKENPAQSTLAHEMFFSLRGQQVLSDKRVSPSFMHPIGGFYTVRGYPESFLAGDNAVVFTGEYRLHVPHLFSPKPAGELFGKPFKWSPQQPLGRPDWDLMLRAFFDIGRVTQNDIVVGEYEETLAGAGVGIEFTFKRNLIARADWGWALEDTFNGQTSVTSGSSQIHLSLTLLY